jgi:hypothetical protein
MRRLSAVRSVSWRFADVPAEALFWIAALVGVACIDPNGASFVNLCLIEQLGLPCPGDGLGTSIAHLARGHWAASWTAHPLGGPVVAVLLYHVGVLFWRAPHRRPTVPASSR